MKDLKIEKNEINFKSNKILKILRYRKMNYLTFQEFRNYSLNINIHKLSKYS